MDRTTLHILGGDSRSRAEQARIVLALGHHAEVYSDLEELLCSAPSEGIVIASDTADGEMAGSLIEAFGKSGMSLPVVIASPNPEIDRVVSAMKAGAIDYLALPLEMNGFVRRLTTILADARQYAVRRKREVHARCAIAMLSRREREVLELLSSGCSNKEIGRRLEISARTVEIHRGHMMSRLAAGHPADAIRIWFDASLEVSARPDSANDDLKGDTTIVGRIGRRPIVSWIADRERRQLP